MNKAYSRINWENYPSTDTPLNETNLNHMDLAVDTIDDRVITLDTTKADESDLLTCVASISFNSTTGIMTITLKNGTQGTIDTGLSKLAINFDYDDDPTSPHYQQIVMEMKDGTYKYIDLSALITQYEFTNSSTIAWTIGNDGTVSASVVDGSITANKLQPNYLADIIVEVGKAQTAATNANADSLEAEGWAVGEQNGVPVSSGSPYYENNAKYYAQQSGGTALSALTDVQLSSPTDGQALVYDANSGKWVNGEGGMHIIQIPVPTVQTYTYNGSIQTFQFDSVDTQHITISGDSQSQAGTYVVTATLKSANDVWSDLTNAPKTFSWTIAKAQGSFSLDSHSVVVNSGTPTATVNVSSIVGDGAITATSADDNVATASYSMGVVTITAVGNGSTTITVTMAESSNYLGASDTISAASSANITVTLTLNGAKEDNITIKDSNDVTVGTCIFATGQTSGTCQITIPANGGTYKFISSVAKALDGSGTNYVKNVTLTNSLSQTVNVFPEDVLLLFWYGLLSNGFMGLADAGATHYIAADHLQNPNSLTSKAHCLGNYTGNVYQQGLITNNPVDVTGYSKLVRFASAVASGENQMRSDLSSVKTSMYTSGTFFGETTAVAATPTKYEMDITSQSGNKYVVTMSRAVDGIALDLYAVYLTA